MSEIVTIPIELLFFPYKPHLASLSLYDKYWRKDGNYLSMRNHPLAQFAEDYVKHGRGVLENLDDHIFVKYEYDYYRNSPTVINDTHKHNATKRIMDMVDSVKKYGYCEGKYNKEKHLIRVWRVIDSKYIPDKETYVLKSRKHRASACCALGIKKIKVKVVS